MSRLSFAVLTAALIAACYQADSTSAPLGQGRLTKVLITDGPFPFDSVQSAKVYIVRIAVSTHADTGTSADSMQWVTVAEPHRQIDLLTLQQGLTDTLGGHAITADQYKAVLVTINNDSSEGIRWKNGSLADVRWYGSGNASYTSFVEAPINVPDTGAVIVLDFDVGQSFQYNNWGDGKFDFFPTIRAVNRAATGNIAGTVTSDTSTGAVGPVANATVSAWGGGPSNYYVIATGKTDAAGHYRLAYLLPGTYVVGVDVPDGNYRMVRDSNVAVTQGFETTHNVVLSADNGSILIQGASSMLTNRTNRLEAFVVNAQHQQDPSAVVAWQNLNTAVLDLVTYAPDSTHVARVTSKAAGSARIVATSGAFADTLTIFVYPDSTPPPAPRR